MRSRKVRAPGLDDFWFGAILWFLDFLGVAVADMDNNTGGGLCSSMQLKLLSCRQRERRERERALIHI